MELREMIHTRRYDRAEAVCFTTTWHAYILYVGFLLEVYIQDPRRLIFATHGEPLRIRTSRLPGQSVNMSNRGHTIYVRFVYLDVKLEKCMRTCYPGSLRSSICHVHPGERHKPTHDHFPSQRPIHVLIIVLAGLVRGGAGSHPPRGVFCERDCRCGFFKFDRSEWFT